MEFTQECAHHRLNMYEAFVEVSIRRRKSISQERYEELLDEINQLDSVMTERLSPVSGTMFAIYHPSLSYLAKDYNLHQLSLEYNGKEPSAFYLKKAIDIARENNVKVIFIQQAIRCRSKPNHSHLK